MKEKLVEMKEEIEIDLENGYEIHRDKNGIIIKEIKLDLKLNKNRRLKS